MIRRSNKLVALNVSLPDEMKSDLLKLMRLKGYATVSEYVRALIRQERSLSKSSSTTEAKNDERLRKEMELVSPSNNRKEDSAQTKVQASLELRKRGIALKQQELRERFPNATERELRLHLTNWIRHKAGAPEGDSSGLPNIDRLLRLKKHNV